MLDARPADVWELLLARGWYRPDDGATHRTWIDGDFRRMSDHIVLGTRAERVHARFFPFAAHTLVAAHHERAKRNGHHVVTSWDLARDTVMEALMDAGCRHMGQSLPVTPMDLRGAPGDGRVCRLAGPDAGR